MFLTAADLVELTERTQGAAQIRWLVRKGWKFELGANGHPKVLRTEADRHMLGRSQKRHKVLDMKAVA